MPRISRRLVLGLTILALFVFAGSQAATIPLDSDGLPAWSIAQWNDFPVRVQLDSRGDLDAMLQAVPIADFSREQVRPEGSPKHLSFVVETRVTQAEFDALERAGYRPERQRDVVRENREASERLWADLYAGKAADVRTDPLNYVPTNDQVGTMLQGLANDYPDKASYFSWGQSVQGRTIHGLVISDNVGTEEAEPEIRYSATMHGDEIVGTVMTINLAYYLLEHYGEPGYEDCTDIVDNYELHLVPAYNPDGTALHQRYNANGVDLNRNFLLPAGTHTIVEPENRLFMDYSNEQHFVVSINFHGGALVMNYVWDYTYALAPDNDACIPLSLAYSTYNLPMYNGAFPQGITNGADWYVATGTLQDWCYDQTDCIDVTGEISNIKWPSNSSLPGFWDDNRESMMSYIRTTRVGTIHGVVTDAGSGQPLDATITLVGNSKVTHTDPAVGDYYKYAPTGTYDLSVSATGYVTQTITDIDHVWGTGSTVDVALQPLATGHVDGVVRDLQGNGLDALVEVRTWPAGELIDAVNADGGNGGAFSLDIFYGDYTLTASAVDHFTESQQVTVSSEPVSVVFELGGMITSYPVDEDFEAGSGVFTGDWVTSSPGYLSDGCLVEMEGTYPDNATLVATVGTPVNLEGVMTPRAMFAAKWNIENSWDAVFFEISTNGGASWTPLAVPGQTNGASGQGVQVPAGVPLFDGSQANWINCSVDLSSYIGQADVRFRFRFASDGSVHYDGFYLDNFKVEVVTEDNGGTTAADVPVALTSLEAYPNPFNPQTTLKLVNPRPGPVEVAVYDLQGRLVRTLTAGEMPAGEHALVWDGSDDHGRRAGSGVYLARLVTADGQDGVKLVMVK